MSAKLKAANFKRGQKRKQITEIHKLVFANISNLDSNSKLTYVNKLKELKTELKILNEEVLDLQIEAKTIDAEIESDLAICQQYEDKIIEALTLISVEPAVGLQTSNTCLPRLKAPIAPLPVFAGVETETLDKFLYNFESIINKYDYSSYEKFLLLKKQISGRALLLIDSLEVNKQSYEEAVGLLRLGFANPSTQKFEVIQKLVELKMPYGKEPFKFVSEIRIIQETFKHLKIDVEVILQFFIWKSMNSALQNIFVSLTNSNKPSLESINENLFPAIERYQALQKKI